MKAFLKSLTITVTVFAVLFLLIGGLFMITAGVLGEIATSMIVWGILAFISGIILLAVLFAPFTT